MTRAECLTRGLITEEPAHLTEPVTCSGWYKATNDYYYEVTWQNGRPTVHATGQSAAYRQAQHEFERDHGPVLDARSHAAFERFLAERFAHTP